MSKNAYVKSMQKLVPEVRKYDLVRWGSGVRAQAILPDGTLVDDFVIKETRNAVHVINAPSPGATSSLSIGEYVTDRAASIFDLSSVYSRTLQHHAAGVPCPRLPTTRPP